METKTEISVYLIPFIFIGVIAVCFGFVVIFTKSQDLFSDVRKLKYEMKTVQIEIRALEKKTWKN